MFSLRELHNYYIKTTNTKLYISDIVEKEYYINFHKTNFPTARELWGSCDGGYILPVPKRLKIIYIRSM